MRTLPSSKLAQRALSELEALRQDFADGLMALQPEAPLPLMEWLRDEGRHGGGSRFAAELSPFFNRLALNISGVHYDDMPERRLRSANALSCIVHPRHAMAPSMHMHISFTEMREGPDYWRVMADLNPATERPAHTEAFRAALKAAAPEHYEEGAEQGDRYFYIPALGRHRGVAHFYLEGHTSGDFEKDREFALSFGAQVVRQYVALLGERLEASTAEQRAAQLAYHSLYFLQVLTLDRGTTSGLLVHDQNDVGILGSLPAFVDRSLLSSWVDKLPAPQDGLLRSLVDALPDSAPCAVSNEVRAKLAVIVREHYRAHPEALKMQARGNIVPPTVDNHRG